MEFSRQDRVASRSLLQGIFLTQGWNPGLLQFRQILYCRSLKGSPVQPGHWLRTAGLGAYLAQAVCLVLATSPSTRDHGTQSIKGHAQ